jgi:hemerythrin
MGDYIALHGLVPQNELPENLRHKIPENEVWIRKDVYDNPRRRERILQDHEKFELELMETRGFSYKQAHHRTELHEKLFKIIEEIRAEEKKIGIMSYDSVTVSEKQVISRKIKQKKQRD